MIFSFKILIGPAFLGDSVYPRHCFKLRPRPNTLQFSRQFIILFQILILDLVIFMLDGILEIVERSDVEDELLVNVSAQLVRLV